MAITKTQRFLLLPLILLWKSRSWTSHFGCHGLTTSSSAKKNTAGTGFGNNQKKKEKQYISVLLDDGDDRDNGITNEFSEMYKRLIDTLKSHNAVLDGTEIGINPQTGQRGLYATKSFSKDKIICKIPSDLALALGDPAQKGADATTLAHAAANFIQFYMRDQSAYGQWKFYLDCLSPSHPHTKNTFIPTTPDFYTDEEIDLLEFPSIVEAAKQRKGDVQRVADEMGIPFDELQRGTAIVSSRSIPLAIAEVDKGNEKPLMDEQGQILSEAGERSYIRLLVPYIDMTNHRSKEFNAVITVLDPEKDEAWFALKATRNIPIGKEITVAYGSGAHTSIDLLLNYGFIEPGNPMDSYLLKKGKTEPNCIGALSDWTTTLSEDKAMLAMEEKENDAKHLQDILRFRIQMKESYS